MLTTTHNGITLTAPSKPNRPAVTFKAYPNGLGIEGYDKSKRCHFSTLCHASRGIGVVVLPVKGQKRYMVVPPSIKEHAAAYEYALQFAPVVEE